jgi:hypothetical protein
MACYGNSFTFTFFTNTVPELHSNLKNKIQVLRQVFEAITGCYALARCMNAIYVAGQERVSRLLLECIVYIL